MGSWGYAKNRHFQKCWASRAQMPCREKVFGSVNIRGFVEFVSRFFEERFGKNWQFDHRIWTRLQKMTSRWQVKLEELWPRGTILQVWPVNADLLNSLLYQDVSGILHLIGLYMNTDMMHTHATWRVQNTWLRALDSHKMVNAISNRINSQSRSGWPVSGLQKKNRKRKHFETLLLWRLNVATQKRFPRCIFLQNFAPFDAKFCTKGRGCSTKIMTCRSTIVIYWYFCTRSTALLTSPKNRNKIMHLKCKTIAPRKCKIIIKMSAHEWPRLTTTAIQTLYCE